MRSYSQYLFLQVRLFEEKYGKTPKYILIDIEGVETLQAEYDSIIAEDDGRRAALKFMGIQLVPTDSIEGIYLVMEYNV